MPRYRLHDSRGDDLGVIAHPAPNVEPGDVVMLEDGRVALVTSRVKTRGRGEFAECVGEIRRVTEFETLPGPEALNRSRPEGRLPPEDWPNPWVS